MIDEIQRIPALLNEVQRCIEAFKPNIVFILTGSSARKLKKEDANLLAGRAIKQDFLALSSDEIDFSTDLDAIMLWGTLPEVIQSTDAEFTKHYLNSYVGTYLEEEIKKESEIRNLPGFRRFLDVAASENGRNINYTKIAKSAGISPNTVKDYYTILTDTLLAYELPAWFYSKRKQLQHSSRYYFFDNGIVTALTGHLSTELKPSTYLYGTLFESMVVTELIRRKRRQVNSLGGMIKKERLVWIFLDMVLDKRPAFLEKNEVNLLEIVVGCNHSRAVVL
jgi:predicted AAA+ superfamily ATPase